MRLAFLALLLCPRPQDPPLEKIVAELEARAPRAKDFDLRYAARMGVRGPAGPVGETRLRVLSGSGFRTDGAIIGMPGLPEGFELDVDASAVEMGDDLYFWASAADGPAEMFEVLPPAVSFRGSRKDFPETLDIFPADFSFRWAYEDLLALVAVAPRMALARDPGLRLAGRETVGEKPYDVLEVRVEKAPTGSLLKVYPIGGMAKRYFVDRSAGRVDHVEYQFSIERETFRFRWSVVVRRELAGGSVPDGIEAAFFTLRGMEWRSEELHLRKRLVAAGADRGLKTEDLLPEERRKDVYVRGNVKSVEAYTAALEKDPESAEAHAGRGLARYREAIAGVFRGGGPPRASLAAAVADFEGAQKVRPSSPTVNLMLLKLYALTGQADRRLALARALEGPADPALRAALARVWIENRDAARALRLLEPAPGPALRDRVDRARLRLAVHAVQGNLAAGGRALADLLEGAAEPEREIVLDVLFPLPDERRAGKADPERLKAVQAALAEEPKRGAVHEMNLRASVGDEVFPAALRAFAAAVDDPAALDRAAGLALRHRDPAAAREAAERMLPKAPRSWRVAALLGSGLVAGGEREAGLRRLEEVLERLEQEPAAEGRTAALFFLALAFAEGGREVPLRRTCRAWVGEPQPARSDDPRTPLFLCVQHLAGKEKYLEAFEEIRQVDRTRLSTMYDLRHALRPREKAFAEAVRARLLAESTDAGELRSFAAVLQFHLGLGAEAVAVLERARVLAPKDMALAHELAVLVSASDSARAAELYGEVLAAGPVPGLDRDPMLYRLALLHQRGGRREPMIAALDRIDLKASSMAELLHLVAQIYEQAGAIDRAMAAYVAFLEGPAAAFTKFRSGAHVRLGKLYEQKGEVEQAYRFYSGAIRAIEEARLVRASPPSGRGVQVGEEPERLREALLKRVGQEGFIDRYLKAGVPEATPAERSRAKALLGQLESDSVIDRDEASDGLKKLGPGCAPTLREALGKGDEEFRARVRQLLWGWAEPR